MKCGHSHPCVICKAEKEKAGPSAMIGLSGSAIWLCPKAFCGLLTRWTHKINPKDGTNTPPTMSGYIEPGGVNKLQTVPQTCWKPPPAAVLLFIVLFSISWLWHKSIETWRHPCCFLQKQKAKDFKSQIIRYLEAMLQSQQRVITQPFIRVF